MFSRKSAPASAAAVVASAAMVLAIAMATRGSWGLFVGPINSTSGFGAASVSLAIAASALAWGFAQPLCGVLLARFGAARLLAGGATLVAALVALVPFAGDGAQLIALMALVGAAGAAGGSAPVLLGLVAERVAPARRGLALGLTSAGGSAGQLAAAPLVALAISAFGWQATMLALAACSLLIVPLARTFRGGVAVAGEVAEGRRVPVRVALARRDFWLVAGGFFVCGFHVTFLTTHMPGVMELCGLPAGFSGVWLAVVGACNIVSSLVSGQLMQRMPMKSLLAALYALRALGVVAFLVLPKSETALLGFALWMGLTYMATVPPTTGLLAQLFGARNLTTLFGFVMMAHQLGSFLGAWLGGVAVEATGDYEIVWWIDIALALAATAVHLPIREPAREAARELACDSARTAPPMRALAAARG